MAKKRKSRKFIPQASIVSDEIFLPNHSGEHTAGTTGTPINDRDIANKKYVDDHGGYWTQSGTDIYYTIGNVGIGTTTPSKNLEVEGGAATNTTLRISAPDDYDPTLEFYKSTGATQLIGSLVYDESASDLIISNLRAGDNTDISLVTGGWEVMRLKGNRDVEIPGDIDVTGAITGGTFSNLDDGTAAGQMSFWNGTKWVQTETSELFWDDVNKILKPKNLKLENTSSISTGVIFKESDSFIHNFSHPTGGLKVPVGRNTFVGKSCGNFTMGAAASETYHGSYNTGVGYDNLNSVTTGYSNTAIGKGNMTSLTSGSKNSAIGVNCLENCSVGGENMAMGSRTFIALTSGSGNVGVGLDTGLNITTGNRNTFIGWATGKGITTGNYNTVIGANVTGLSTTLGNTVIIADGSGNKRIYVNSSGNAGLGTTTPQTKLHTIGTTRFGDQATNYFSTASDGEVSLAGTARVKRHVWATAESFRPSGATVSTQGINTHLIFRNVFDDKAYYSTHVPYRWASGTDIEIVLVWYYTGGDDNNTCEWNVSYNSVADGEDPTGAGTALAEQAVAIATDDTVEYTTFTIPAAALATHDNLFIKIWRDGSDAMTANALLLGMHVHFTMDKLGEST